MWEESTGQFGKLVVQHIYMYNLLSSEDNTGMWEESTGQFGKLVIVST